MAPREARVEERDQPRGSGDPGDGASHRSTARKASDEAREGGGSAKGRASGEHHVERGVTFGLRDPGEKARVFGVDQGDEVDPVMQVEELDDLLETRATVAVGVVREDEMIHPPPRANEKKRLVKGSIVRAVNEPTFASPNPAERTIVGEDGGGS